jgi:hypothetical protein
MVPLLALKHVSDHRIGSEYRIPLGPSLDHSRKTGRNYCRLEELRLFPEAAVLVRLTTNQSTFWSCKLTMVPDQSFVLIASQAGTEK